MSELIAAENLPQLLNEQKDALLNYIGQTNVQSGSSLNSLRVNYKDRDMDGRDLKRGLWTFPHEGKQVYSDDLVFRILLTRFQYSHYDMDAEKTLCTSVYFTEFGEEVPDDQGGFKCGKLSRKEIEALEKEGSLTEMEQNLQKDIKLSRVLFGYVSCTAHDSWGNEYEVTEHPCVFYGRGTNYIPTEDLVRELTRKRILAPSVNIKMNLKEESNQSNTKLWWVLDPEIVDNVDVSKEDIEMIRDTNSQIEAENKIVVDKFTSKQGKSGDNVGVKMAEEIPLDNDFNDELPDSMLAGG